jgi:hypothetical protein
MSSVKTSVVADLDQLPFDINYICCPKCGKIQKARVVHQLPKPLYRHECLKCFFIITESDWNPILKP